MIDCSQVTSSNLVIPRAHTLQKDNPSSCPQQKQQKQIYFSPALKSLPKTQHTNLILTFHKTTFLRCCFFFFSSFACCYFTRFTHSHPPLPAHRTHLDASSKNFQQVTLFPSHSLPATEPPPTWVEKVKFFLRREPLFVVASIPISRPSFRPRSTDDGCSGCCRGVEPITEGCWNFQSLFIAQRRGRHTHDDGIWTNLATG